MNLPLKNKTAWLLVLALLPPIYFACSFYFKLQELALLEERISSLQQKALLWERQKNLSATFFENLKQADHFYIDKHLETLSFLNKEQPHNRLLFAEENIRRGPHFQEVSERQQKPVELNEADLKKVLCLIEGISIPPYQPEEGRPDLIIQDFDLSKKMISAEENVYQLSMQLLKREPLTK